MNINEDPMKYNMEKLLTDIAANKPVKYLFFWGHTQKGNDIDKSCFSQWFPSEFDEGGILYQSAEHWMMAKKAILFSDEEMFDSIIKCASPAEAKKLGRKVRGFDPTVWDAQKMEIVVQGNYLKFSQNEAMGDFLKTTTKRVIVEASPYDRIWGIGMAQDHKNANYPDRWNGKNLLGFALMEVRDMLLQME